MTAHAHKPNEQANNHALRDRMARALLKAWSAPDEYADVARRTAREEAAVCAKAAQPEIARRDQQIANLQATVRQVTAERDELRARLVQQQPLAHYAQQIGG